MKLNVEFTLLSDDNSMIDESADDATQIQLTPETGVPGCFKLYIHYRGRTVVRICKIKAEQITVGGPLQFVTTGA